MQIKNQLCRCGSYNAVLEIEIAQRQKAVTPMENVDTSVLPMQPKSDVKKVLTVFCLITSTKTLTRRREVV